MQLTMLNAGLAYLTRSQQNRSRMLVTQFALGGALGYVPEPGATSFKQAVLFRAPIDAQQVSGDTVTFTAILPAALAVSFGEIGVYAPDGTLIAMNVLSSPLVKVAGTEMQLTLITSAGGLGAQMTFVNNKVFLSRTRPDFDDLLLQMQSAAYEKASWSGLVTNETGTTLLEMLAGVGEFDAYMFNSALEENFSDTAKLDSSQYAIQNMLSNRLTRKAPAGADITMARVISTAAKVIPPYTLFTSNGKNLFNREALLFKAGQTTISARLYEGSISTANLTGLGLDYQFWVSSDDKFTVSDQDVVVSVSGVKIPVVEDSLWNYADLPAVQDSTDKSGRLMLRFGNASLGTRPEVTDSVAITYVITSGTAGNDSTFVGATITCPSVPDFGGLATTALTGGGDQPAVTLYQRMGGDLFGGQKGAVTPSQYRAKARQYPGVLDAVVLAQRDLAPMDKNWFNTGKLIVLTSAPWSDADKAAYELWYRKRTMYSMRYQVLTGDGNDEPRKKQLDVSVRISCRNDADLVDIQSKADGAVRKLFVPRAGILSRNLYLTDISDAIRAVAPELIDFCIIDQPLTDIGMDIVTPKVSVQVIEGQGTIPPGNYTYGIASSDADGRTVPNKIAITTTAANSTIVFTWDSVLAATGYVIYGRTDPFGQLATVVDVPNTTLTYTDDGTVVGPATPAESINTSGVHYATLGQLVVNVEYSRRRQVEDLAYNGE